MNKPFLFKLRNQFLMGMAKGTYHPNAYLSKRRNVKLGLKARTQILTILEKASVDARTIAEKTNRHYRIVMYHLKLLKAEEIVERKGDKKPTAWTLTGVGQKRLLNSS